MVSGAMRAALPIPSLAQQKHAVLEHKNGVFKYKAEQRATERHSPGNRITAWIPSNRKIFPGQPRGVKYRNKHRYAFRRFVVERSAGTVSVHNSAFGARDFIAP